MGRVVLPMEEMAARAGDANLEGPLAYKRASALNVLDHLTTNEQCQSVFEICCHKVEYVDEMAQVRLRHIEARNNCLKQIGRGLRNSAKKGPAGAISQCAPGGHGIACAGERTNRNLGARPGVSAFSTGCEDPSGLIPRTPARAAA